MIIPSVPPGFSVPAGFLSFSNSGVSRRGLAPPTPMYKQPKLIFPVSFLQYIRSQITFSKTTNGGYSTNKEKRS